MKKNTPPKVFEQKEALNGTFLPEQTISSEEFLKLREELLEKQASMESRLWIDSSLSKFDEVLRHNFDNTLEKFADNIIEHICQVLKAVHGAFFIVEDGMIKAMGGYACTVATMATKQFRIGEGLIGQAAKSKEILRFENLETRLESSLGRVTASCLTVCPLIFNQDIYGVIEVTTLKALEDRELELLQRMCRNTASFLQSFISNRSTKLLLEASQQQTEELRAQEEELRQSMEELQAIQEEAIRKNTELEGFIRAIDSTLATVEFDMTGRIKTANQKFLALMGYKHDEIIGMPHSIFVAPDYAKSEDYKIFWQSLNKGILQTSSDIKRITKRGEEVWLSATYTPILDIDGRPFKVLKFALDNTANKKQLLDYKWQMEAINKSFAVIEFDLDSTIRTANDNFLNAVGYSLGEVRGQKHKIFVDAEHQNKAYTELWENLKNGHFQAGEFPRITKEKKQIWINGSYNPIFDSENKPYKIVKYVRDVTPQKAFRHEIKQYVHHLNQHNAVAELSLEGKLESFTDDWLSLLGTNREKTAHKHFDTLLVQPKFQDLLATLLIEKELKRDLEFKGKKITLVTCYLKLIEDLSGQPLKIVSLLQKV